MSETNNDYLIEITEEVSATDPKSALQDTLHLLHNEETVAKVTHLQTGNVFYIECQTGLFLDDFPQPEPTTPQDLDKEKQALQDMRECKIKERWEITDLTEDEIPF